MKNSDRYLALRRVCRQCKAAVTNAPFCPLCGVYRPDESSLSASEKQCIVSQPTLPPRFDYLIQTTDPAKPFFANFLNELKNLMLDSEKSGWIYVSMIVFLISFVGILAQVLFPLNMILFLSSLLYCGFESLSFAKALNSAYIIKRLQFNKGGSPYSVFFKIETQIIKLLENTQVVLDSFFDQQQPEKMSDSFLSAIGSICSKTSKFADLSLQTFMLLWKGNVYSLLAKDIPYKDKIIALGNKIKEAEAFIMRHVWLKKIKNLHEDLKTYIAQDSLEKSESDAYSTSQSIIAKYNLTRQGPVSENFSGDLLNSPYEIPFKARYFWHQQLPPFPLTGDELISECPETREFFQVIDQVRHLKTKIEEQMILDYASDAVVDASGNYETAYEARQMQQFDFYHKFLDVKSFEIDEESFSDKVDKLKAEMRVNFK